MFMTIDNKKKKGQTPNVTAITQKKEYALDVKYHEIYKTQKNPDWLREKLVKYAKKNGIRAASREFECSRNTVRRWFYDETGTYLNKSKRPKTINSKISEETEELIKDSRGIEGMGADNLTQQYNIPASESTVYRVLKRNNLIRTKKQRKRQLTKDLRKLKAKKKCFEVVQVDGKVLNDIHNFYPYYKEYSLPLWQLTFTCQKSGATFYSYCQGETSIAACTFIVYAIEHLKRHGIEVKRINTDHGSFALGNNRSLKHTAFQSLLKKIYKIKHYPIQHKNQNADVERFHGLVEQYFYSICKITSKKDFYSQATNKQIWFNYIRKNGGKNWQTPLEIFKKDYPKTDPQVLALRPIDLDKHNSIYRYKIDPEYKPLTFESFFLDVPKEDLELIKEVSKVGHNVMKVDVLYIYYHYTLFIFQKNISAKC